MSDEIKNSEKKSKSIMRSSKAVKYSRNLMFVAGAMGVTTGVLLSNTVKAEPNKKNKDGNLKNTVDETQAMLKNMRNRNKMYIRGANLELIQLMEQGDQVVKSPWSSWQFGMNFFSNADIISGDGYGDKEERYTYNGLYFRNNWKMKNALATLDSMGVMGLPITPGSDSQVSWRNATGNIYSEMNFDKSKGSSVNGEVKWGLVELRKIQEPLNEVEILARISPKEVKKEAVSLSVAEPTVEPVGAPVVDPKVNTPLTAPVITIPGVEINIAPSEPTINVTVNRPDLNPLTITKPAVVNVTPPTVATIEPVAFSVAPTIDSTAHKIRQNSNNSTVKDSDGNFINNMNKALRELPELPNILKVEKNTGVRNFVTISGSEYNSNVDANGVVTNPVILPNTKRIDITVDNNRALVIDETAPNFEFHSKGTINLYGSQNMGIDLQGTHTGSKESPAITTIINEGMITGYASNTYDNNKATKEQIAFGFSNADASNNTTMTHMVNTGTITLNAPSSAGMQLKPEDPHYWEPDWNNLSANNKMIINRLTPKRDAKKYGKVLMKADNRNTISLEGSKSFGIITVFNPGISELDTVKFNETNFPLSKTNPDQFKINNNLRAQRNIGEKILPGGEIGRSALTDSKYTSGVYNTGKININGDQSVGVGILHEIQEVKVGGTINIGTTAVTQETGVSNLETTVANPKIYDINKVEEAVGVFAGVPTLPVKVNEVDTMGNTNNTGATIGTETTEVSGTINIGINAKESIGLLVGDSVERLNKGELKRSGSITYKASANDKINVDGNQNYGFVVNSESHKSVYGSTLNDLQYSTDKENHGIGINEGKIEVVGSESIGFALLKGGNSQNSGTINIKDPTTAITGPQGAIGFYGEQDKFTNTGTIQILSSSGTVNKENKAVVLNGINGANKIVFENNGNIYVNAKENGNTTNLDGKGNIGVYAQGSYTFNHNANSKMIVGSDATGFYVTDVATGPKKGEINILSSVKLADSSANGTTIGFYSDGNANVNFGTGSKLTIGKKAVGIYSADSKKLSDTFKIKNGELLDVELGENSAFALVSGNRADGSPELSKFFNGNENPTGNGIKISSFGKGATLVYSNNGGKAILGNGTDAATFSINNGTNKSTSILSASGQDANSKKSVVGIAQKFTLTTNTKVALSSSDSAEAINEGTIISTRSVYNAGLPDNGVGIYANNSTGENASTGIIEMQKEGAVGIFGESNSTLTNSGKIEVSKATSAGIYGKDSDITNSGTGIDKGIYVKEGSSAGIFGVVSGTVPKTITNTGDIITEAMPTGDTESAGIYGEVTSAGSKLTIAHTGNITVNGNKSVGIYAKNGSGAVANLVIDNIITTGGVTKKGTININKEKSVGIYAPKSTVSGVGKITLGNDANESIGVYAAAGSAITTTTAEIDLGKGPDQNRVAYYVKNENTALTGDNIGKISGYGVGVYLEGTSATDVAKLITPPTTPSTPALDYTTGNNQGNGIIGLYLRGNTDISGYKKQITVGNTVEDRGTKYAIGIYADSQGTETNKYQIQAPITTGENGIGIFAANNSNIKYHDGTINVGKNGIGIYVQEKGSSGTSKVELGSTASGETFNGPTINLAEGSVAAIVGENAHFDGGNATIDLSGSGVGVYGLKGSVTNVKNWTFNNHGNSAEEVRSKEGTVKIDDNKDLKPGIVLSHVINGETYIVSGKTVKSKRDGSIDAGKNIGLMAEGIKNGNGIHTGYEIVNQGEIDFKAGSNSTGIYAASARVKNDGKIKVGSQSTGIYGEYINLPHPNFTSNDILKVETTANSEIELGQGSVGVYLKNASTGINLDGKITSSAGATQNVGIYMINNAGAPLNGMINNSEITLGDGSVGLYSRGKGSATANRNTVTNNGKITVGKKIAGTPSVPSVGIYSENTNLSTGTTSDITVGEDGIAFYGKHSDITANGTVNFNNKGVLAYLEDSKFVSHLGNISPTQNTMLYLKNSTAQMDGSVAGAAPAPVDITVADGYTGAYVEGNSRLTGVRKINLGRNSNGIFLQKANFDSTGITEIVGTQANAKGILGIKSSLLNKTKISLSGDNSIAIYSDADSTKSVVNEGKLELSGKKTLGVFLKGSQSFENKADISIADSSDAHNPTIGVYTSSGTSPITLTSGNIEVGVKSIGVYSTTNSPVNMTGGNLHVKDEGMGIYKQDGSVSVAGNIVVDPHTATTPNTEPVGVYAVNGASVNDSANVTVGEKSYGFILNNDDPSKVNTYTNTAGTSVTLGSDSTYLYSGGKAQITNNKDIAAGNVDRVIGFYVKGNNTGGGNFVNNGLLDFSNGKGNIGVYAPGSTATNSASGRIYVGATDYTDPLTGQIYSDKSKIVYGIGMATDNGGQIANDGEIRIFGDKSIGMYGSGAGTVVENRGNILLDGSRATASNKIESMTGVYVDEGAKFVNKGIIQTTDSYAGRGGMVNPNVSGLVGVAVMNGSTLVNEAGAKILIDADNSYGVVIRGKKNPDGTVQRYATIKNYGEIKVRGKGTYGISWKDITPAELADLEAQINSRITSDPNGQEVRGASGTDKEFEGVKISIKNGQPVFTKDGVPVSDAEVAEISKLIGNESNLGLSDIGFYVDTLGRTRPIDIDGSTPPINSQLIIGTEYSEMTNSKYWVVKGDVIKPFLDQVTGRNFKLTSLAGSLTWMATPILDSYGEITGVAMAKVPYTSFVRKTENAWNFTDGLEQRYGVNSLDSREKLLFNKLNSIGNNEPVLLTQAFDEMMGHQYANIQQRTYGTGRLIDKEITHLAKEWETKSKQSNKIKVFGMKDEYTTDTAGIIDYTSDAYGFAYLHEDETVKLGNVSGWYAGGVHNKFKFKDIGGSRENQTMLKLGIFKTMTPASDHNGNLQWTISGEGYVSKNEMHRKYLVVDEIFNAKSDYTTYGVAVKNEVGYNIRTSERTSIRPYGSLKVEYGRFSNIKEKSGEMRLDVEGNGYYSIKPAIGVEFNYRQPFAVKSIFTASLGLGYESELGKVGNVNNRARVSYTSADWFNIRGEKDNRKGKLRADLNFGIENSRVGMTLNTGYDSDNNNLRGGLGFRLIY